MLMVTICEMNSHKCRGVAALHCDALRDDFLPSLGIDYLEKGYYKASIENPCGKVFVAEINGEIVGFINVSINSRKYLRSVWGKKTRLLLTAILRLFATRPIRFFEGIAISLAKVPVHRGGEIVFIAVDPAHQKQGIGKMLVEAAHRYFLAAGVHFVFTKTLESNKQVIRMYQRFGAETAGKLKILKKEYLYLSWNI